VDSTLNAQNLANQKAISPKPIPIEPQPERIPAELRKLRQWVVWKYELNGAKWTKLPYNAETGHRASTTNPQTWTSFGNAARAYQHAPGGVRRYDGVGFVFTADDPYCGVDFDHCFDDVEGEKVLQPDAARWVETLATYTEFSVSGGGLHSIARAALSRGGNNHAGGVEIYDRGRYFTFTGDSYHDDPLPIADRQEVADAFIADYFPPKNSKPERLNGHTGGQFATWDALRAELGRRITGHETARRNGGGKIDCRGVCHDGEGNSGLFYDPATNQARCNRGCDQATIFRAFGLPDKPDLPIAKAAKAPIASNGHAENGHASIRPSATEDSGNTQSKTDVDGPILNVVRMADVQAQKVSWLWQNRIALRAIAILEGIEGEGKSTLLAALTAGITCGRGLPETEPGEPGNVVWLSAEDDLSQVLKPRLESAGADCERVFAVGEPFTLDEKGLLGLREAIANHAPTLVVIDPIFAYTRGDANKGNDARALTGELKKIADQFECAIVIVRHVGKSKGLGDPRAAGLYSIEWRAAARSVLLAGADPDNPQKRALTQTKNNLGPKSGSLGYLIQSDPDSPSGARFFWTGESDLTAERILEAAGEAEENSQENNARDDAADFLRVVLGDAPRLATDVEAEAKEAKISIATLRRAKDKLNVRSRKFGGKFGGDSKWYWALPEDAHTEDAHTPLKMLTSSEGEHLQANQTDKSSYGNDLAEDAHLEINEHLQGEARCSGEHLQAGFDPILEALDR